MDTDRKAGKNFPPIDPIIAEIATYVHEKSLFSDEAYRTARLAFFDALGCAVGTLTTPTCRKLIGDKQTGLNAFQISTLIRWHDFNDTWLAAEWGHPSDNLGALLTATPDLSFHELLTAMIQAYEIQGILALSNNFHTVGLDHVLLVKVASAAVSSRLLGNSYAQTVSALSNAFVDLTSLRTYRHAPCVGPRKGWAAGDASQRGLFFAKLAKRGEPGYPNVLSAPKWGLQDVLFQGAPLTLERPLSDYVMENILFKVAFPAEFHGQTAAEAALLLYPKVKHKLNSLQEILITTQKSALTIIDKKGPLKNPADRDHCLQYIVAVCLLFGKLTSAHYEEPIANDKRIDDLRKKMRLIEEPQFSKDYLDKEKRSIGNRLILTFQDGTKEEACVEYPLGHRRRRQEALPLLFEKYQNQIQKGLPQNKAKTALQFFEKREILDDLPIAKLLDLIEH